jgi:pimeloyl-ACP methyl ester carboxylesterase
MNKSKLTNNTFEIPKPLIFTSRFLQFFSNTLAARFLSHLFETPPKFKIPEREETFRKSAQSEVLHIPDIQKDITVFSYGYSKSKVLLLHGWSGRGSQLYHLADKILENRMMVISVDAPAHGLSSGKKTNMLEYIRAIEEIDKKYGPFDYAIGHSWGGMTLLNALGKKLKLKKAVIIGADNKISEVISEFVKKFQVDQSVTPVIIAHYCKLLKVQMDQFDSEKVAARIDIPVLVIHDTMDAFVPVSSAIEIRQQLKKGSLLITNGLGHHKIFKDPEVMQKIINFIQ